MEEVEEVEELEVVTTSELLVTGGSCMGSPTITIFEHLDDVIGNKLCGSIICEHSSKNNMSKDSASFLLKHVLLMTLAHVTPTTL